MKEDIGVKVMWTVKHVGIDGAMKSVSKQFNTLTNQGKDYILNTAFHGGTAITAWYYKPMENDYTVLGTETYAAPGFTEATTTISEATRQEWQEGAASSQVMTNATTIEITAASAVTIYGGGLCGGGSAASTKGDTAGGGTMLNVAKFSPSKYLEAGEKLQITCIMQYA